MELDLLGVLELRHNVESTHSDLHNIHLLR